ncbi:DHH family phosphoesterase [Effusibacillus pohliae]|uniref:DHH family phosphoesterase n=1 Tax=Effusibacillus pohliae TaxID=232270 RepID=UPI00058AFD2A|nr:bifunctional oligoribonuclease/PAP phosphatase NrnA [Effusibacillus pohliae]
MRMMQEAADFLRRHDDFLLLTHVQPDGDALGSTLGFAHLLHMLGKRFTVAVEEPVPDRFRFLPLADAVRLAAEIPRPFASVVALDCGDLKRLGSCAALVAEDACLLNIDHHKTNDQFGQINLVDADAAATSQIVYNLARFMNVAIDRKMATCLYTGLLTDTGGFRYSNTTVEVHHMAADLLAHGVAPYDVAERALETLTWSQVQLIREGLAGLKRDDSGQIAWIAVNREQLARAGATDQDTEGLVAYARNIQGVEVGILFREQADGTIKVSLRSKRRVDVGEIALLFGGGGHARAAGCILEGPIEQAALAVLAKVREAVGS